MSETNITNELSEPLKVDLGDNPGPVEFGKIEEIIEWANKQSAWSEQIGRQRNNTQCFHRMYERQEAPSKEILSIAIAIKDGEEDVISGAKAIKVEFKKYKEHEAVHSEGSMGQILERLSANDTWAGPGALAAAIGYPANEFVGSFNNQQLGSYAGGYLFMQSSFPQLREKEAASIRVQLNHLFESEAQEASARKAQHREIITDLQTRVDELGKEASSHRATLEALQKQYDSFMKLDSPAKYWGTRSSDSLRYARIGAIAFGIVSAIGLAGALLGYPLILEKFKGVDGTLGAGTIGLMTAPAAIILTALALIFRAVSSWLKDASVAGERHTMIMTYIAFAGDEDNPIDEEHRRHILDRMFTYANDGNAIKDQAHPYLEAIRAAREVKRSSND